MTRLWDTFLLCDELDMLECRLTELDASPVYRHVIVEATVSHQKGEPKPLHYAENRERFAAWADRIVYVIADDLPPGPDPWPRLNAQREWCAAGLGDAEHDDVILHGDADEIPAVQACVTALESPGTGFDQRCAVYAADWLYPHPWRGTAAARARDIAGFTDLRARSKTMPGLPDAGWHLSWMGGPEAHRRKLGQHCHLEMTAETTEAIADGRWYREGLHSDGTKLIPAEVDESWPRWVHERRCPPSWFRP